MPLLIGLVCSLQTLHAAKGHDTTIEHDILVYVNQYRQQHHLPPLQNNAHIAYEARNHSIDMANHTMPFGHKYFKSRIDRLHDHIKNSNAGAENVAYNYKDGQDVVKNWLKSPGHRRNIEGNYNLTGIGIARDARGKIYFTQIFLRTGKTAPGQRKYQAASHSLKHLPLLGRIFRG
jgi:uncharacterized protein YkwD